MDDILRVNISLPYRITHKTTSVDDIGPVATLTFTWSHRCSSGGNKSSPSHYPSTHTRVFKTKHRLAISSFHLGRPALSNTVHDARRTRIFRRTANSHFASPLFMSPHPCSQIAYFFLKMIEKRNRLARSPHHHPTLDIHTDNTLTQHLLSPNSPTPTLPRSFLNTNSRFYPPRPFLPTIS